jgi:hypothetical protein
VVSVIAGDFSSVDKVGVFIYFWVGFLLMLLSCFGLRLLSSDSCGPVIPVCRFAAQV